MKEPTSIEIEFINSKYISMFDSINGTTSVDVIFTGVKRVRTIKFEYLTFAQFNSLLTYVNNGFWTVIYTITEYAFTGLHFVKLIKYGEDFAGGKKGVVITIYPQSTE